MRPRVWHATIDDPCLQSSRQAASGSTESTIPNPFQKWCRTAKPLAGLLPFAIGAVLALDAIRRPRFRAREAQNETAFVAVWDIPQNVVCSLTLILTGPDWASVSRFRPFFSPSRSW